MLVRRRDLILILLVWRAAILCSFCKCILHFLMKVCVLRAKSIVFERESLHRPFIFSYEGIRG